MIAKVLILVTDKIYFVLRLSLLTKQYFCENFGQQKMYYM